MIDDDNSRFLSGDLVQRVRNVPTVLLLTDDLDSFLRIASPGWRVHRLSGDRRDEWSVSISGNWRMTFVESEGFISNLNLEDYH